MDAKTYLTLIRLAERDDSKVLTHALSKAVEGFATIAGVPVPSDEEAEEAIGTVLDERKARQPNRYVPLRRKDAAGGIFTF